MADPNTPLYNPSAPRCGLALPGSFSIYCVPPLLSIGTWLAVNCFDVCRLLSMGQENSVIMVDVRTPFPRGPAHKTGPRPGGAVLPERAVHAGGGAGPERERAAARGGAGGPSGPAAPPVQRPSDTGILPRRSWNAIERLSVQPRCGGCNRMAWLSQFPTSGQAHSARGNRGQTTHP